MNCVNTFLMYYSTCTSDKLATFKLQQQKQQSTMQVSKKYGCSNFKTTVKIHSMQLTDVFDRRGNT
jgi:hypothetical protein